MSMVGTAEVKDFDAIGEDVKKDTAEQELEKELSDPRLNEIYEFDFEHTDGRGRYYMGHFKTKILDMSEKASIGSDISRFFDMSPVESIPQDMLMIARMICHLNRSLDPKHIPEWAKNLGKIKDIRLLQALFREVLGHERIFFGYDATEADSEAQG